MLSPDRDEDLMVRGEKGTTWEIKFFNKDLEHSCWLVIVEVLIVEQYVAIKSEVAFWRPCFLFWSWGAIPK